MPSRMDQNMNCWRFQSELGQWIPRHDINNEVLVPAQELLLSGTKIQDRRFYSEKKSCFSVQMKMKLWEQYLYQKYCLC